MFAFAAAAASERQLIAGRLLLACAVFGYRISVRHCAVRGVTPWRFPSIVWALICFAIGPIGLIVELLAGATTRPRAEVAVPATGVRERSDPPLLHQFELSGTAAIAVNLPVAARPQHRPPVGADGQRPAPFGWYPDVTGRHHYRYFDGKYWSDQVADDGLVSLDPLEGENAR